MSDKIDIEQGSIEWLHLRKSKITATDAAVIMGLSPYKTKAQLYEEKISDKFNNFKTASMQRGLDLEPIARSLFELKTCIPMTPAVFVKDWAMASLDGFNEYDRTVLEIKCPGERDHAIALEGKVPGHYYPQLQHQMYVAGATKAYYFSFDGHDGISILVKRDEEFIERMVKEELEFYDCLMKKISPTPFEFLDRGDEMWRSFAIEYKRIVENMKSLEAMEATIRDSLIMLCGESNCRGFGISVSQVARKGAVDYSKIPELGNLDLEQYRKPASKIWRITCV